MASLSSGVFERSGSDQMSRRTFYFILGALLAWGFLATSVVSDMTAAWKPGLGMILLVGLALPIAGICMSVFGGAALSFIGFHFVVIPFGAILGPLLAQYELAQPGIVGQAAFLTAIVTGVMGVSGVLFPSFYRGIGGALFGALMALVVVSVLSLFIPALANLTIIHWIAAGIFALYIGYDMWRASEIPATLDNAIDVAVSLYLDILNFFLRILAILGKK